MLVKKIFKERGLGVLNLIPFSMLFVYFIYPKQKVWFFLFIFTYSLFELIFNSSQNDSVFRKNIQKSYVIYLIISVVFYFIIYMYNCLLQYYLLIVLFYFIIVFILDFYYYKQSKINN